MSKNRNSVWLSAWVSGAFALAGCGGGDGEKESGKADGGEEVHETYAAAVPGSAAEAAAQVKEAVAAVTAAGGKEAVDGAAFRAQADILAAAEFLLESESAKISSIANRARFRGAVQNLKLMAEKLHAVAHDGADGELVGKLCKAILAEIDKVMGYLS